MQTKNETLQPELVITKSKYLRTKEAAAYCGMSESFFEKARHFGKGGCAYFRKGRSVYYKIEDLIEWMESSSRYCSTSEYTRREEART